MRSADLVIAIELVGDIVVVQAGLQDKRSGFRQDVGGGQRGIYHQILHLLPGNIVADGDGGI